MTAKVNKPLIQAALGQKPDRYPVWFMRQAGRYLPEYREVRAKVDFTTLCQTPSLAAEVTWQPLRRYDVDASIIFSDILIPCVGMGQKLTFDKGEGPVLSNPIRSDADLLRLKRADAVKDLGYVGEAIALTKTKLTPTQTMIGFAGAPFTVASYMIEGGSSKNFTEVKRLMFQSPHTFKSLLNLISEVTIDYLKMQHASGADVLMLFDTWAGQVTPEDYRSFILPAVQQITSALKADGVPMIYFPGQGSDRLPELTGLGVDVISIDWRTRLRHAQKLLQEANLNVTLQGNLDPQKLICSEEAVRQETRRIMTEAKDAGLRGHIFNLGHRLLPHTPPESLTWVINELRS